MDRLGETLTEAIRVDDDFIPFGVIGGILLLAVVLFVGVLSAAANRLSFPGKVAAIEQLRQDVRLVDIDESEDVIGQVVAVNQTIRSNQRYNDMPFVCLTIPNGWDRVETIKIPAR